MTQTLEQQLQTIGESIKASRTQRGLSMATVSEEAGIGIQTLVRIEAGYPGMGALNLMRVLDTVGLSDVRIPYALTEDNSGQDGLACQPLHIDSQVADDTLEEATSAACVVLNNWLKAERPEVNGIGSNFQGLLKEHLKALLEGRPGHVHRYAIPLNKLVYSDTSVGGPTRAPGDHLWVLQLKGTKNVLDDFKVRPLTSDVDPYSSREDAVRGFQRYVERAGHPPAGVDAVPVHFDDVREQYVFAE